mgnify:FL=1|tara:strand:- start:731 stop:1039 length:309 start_codon:yes stop_codon:yes gene_type:complete
MGKITQNQLIGYWAKSRGITLKDLETHKRIDDVILLLQYKDSFGMHLSRSEKATWGAIWGSVYHKNKPIKPKMLDKLAHIGTQIKHRQDKINSLRQQSETTQ